MKKKENKIDIKLITVSGSGVSFSKSCVSSKECYRSQSVSSGSVSVIRSSSSLSASVLYSSSPLSINRFNQHGFEKVKTFSVIKKPAYDQPYMYAYDVIADCGIYQPPIPIEQVLDYHGLQVKEFSYSESPFSHLDHDADLRKCSWLKWETKTIYVNKYLSHGRKRTSIFYECGHHHIPWHHGINYLSDEADLCDAKIKILDHEAFQYAAELAIPRIFLSGDFDSIISFNQISKIRKKYDTSFELSAIRFSKLNPLKCCFIVVDIKSLDLNNVILSTLDYRITIRYFASSKGFPCYLRAGSDIKKYSSTYNYCLDSFVHNYSFQEEILLSDFSLSKNIRVIAEFKSYISSSSVFILLWIPEQNFCLL